MIRMTSLFRPKSLWLLLLVFCTMGACATSQQQTAAYGTVVKKLSVQEGYELVRKNRDNPVFVVLDVRTPEEFADGHVEGAITINYHDENFVDQLSKLDRNKTYLVYCRTGRRSGDTADVMVRQGFKDLYRIDGDIVQWKRAGLPLVKDRK